MSQGQYPTIRSKINEEPDTKLSCEGVILIRCSRLYVLGYEDHTSLMTFP